MFYQILVEATQSRCTIFDEFSSRRSRGILGGILKKKLRKCSDVEWKSRYLCVYYVKTVIIDKHQAVIMLKAVIMT